MTDQHIIWQHDKKRQFQRIFSRQAIRSYVYLSLGIGVVAAALPILLMLFGDCARHCSISHYYYAGDNARNILVGSLWATGVFLILFHGLSDLENWALNVAGAAAISVAMNPTTEDQSSKIFGIHAASAVLFFVCLAIVAIFFSKGRIRFIVSRAKKRFFTIAYNAAGFAMIAIPAIIAAIHVQHFGLCDENRPIFWIESSGIWAFAGYWFVKTYEYRLLLRIR